MSHSDRSFASASAKKAFEKGFQDKAEEINEIGWESAKNKFNADHPAPYKHPSDATAEGIAYSQGENEAILHYMDGDTPKSETDN